MTKRRAALPEPSLDGLRSVGTTKMLNIDLETNPQNFSDYPVQSVTAVAWMWMPGGIADHDTLDGFVLPIGAPEGEYVAGLRRIRALLVEADIITGHNINNFDLPSMNGAFMMHGIDPLPSVVTQDTLRVLPRKHAMSASQDSLVGLPLVCPIGMPIEKPHRSPYDWYRANMGWENKALLERCMQDVHANVHLREYEMSHGMSGAPKVVKMRRSA